ncbi:hypothetical protein L228DRAFT_96047 [Xylona heveae TC161]|uniref:GIT Spa2 homology (SHD) domain-containing protein n=1 Tax=Xylona heveae (strain CBS 132557 / TC161) TaxID=1328760 RepID=A0A165I5J3_XYLHT|nr:hypothetical protein L228DRAFT_96047 [Xylona heveae TC161]KZF24415.1 hypothetical protein L228DRAFT_96047 [Xylona heveae TC161]
MNGPSRTLSPVSVAGSEWSGISKYQSVNGAEPPYSPSLPQSYGGSVVTPPPQLPGSSAGPILGNIPPTPGQAPESHPSPPSSVARSSTGTGLSTMSEGTRSRRKAALEEILSEHYIVLRKYLEQNRDEKSAPRPNRARDKLLRLSAVQFQELSTDVFDELLRREPRWGRWPASAANPPADRPATAFLQPKDEFHPKRNQARQKLSTLPPPRFRDLATDVFYELERRFPKFAVGDLDSPSSTRGPPSRIGGPNGAPNGGPRPDSRSGSKGPAYRGPGGPGMPGMGPGGQVTYGSGAAPRSESIGPPSSPGLATPGESPSSDYGRPQPKTFQSNTIIPNKSTLIEDDDDQTGVEDDDEDEEDDDHFEIEGAVNGRQSKISTEAEVDKKLVSDYKHQIGELQEEVDNLKLRMREKEEEVGRLQSFYSDRDSATDIERKEWSDLRSDLEHRLSDAQSLNESLKTELEKVRTEHTDVESSLREQLENARSSDADNVWKSRHEDLEKDHTVLQTTLAEQEQVTEEVRQQASLFLEEMKAISERSTQSLEREESLVHQIKTLEQEVEEWKDRYARTKTQLRTLRASSIGLPLQPQDVSQYARDSAFVETDGLVRDVHVTKFQIAIDQLLRAARGNTPASVLDHMKIVVLSVRRITQDLSSAPTANGEAVQQWSKLKARVSATANNLIIASKNFSAAGGLSPVSLLDAAVSHLTAAVVDLLRAVKIRPSAANELEDDEESSTPMAGSVGYPSGANSRVSGGSSYSSASSHHSSQSLSRVQGREAWSPRRQASRGNGTTTPKTHNPPLRFGSQRHSESNGTDDLKLYLDKEVDPLVEAIRRLVDSIQSDDRPSTIRNHLENITSMIGKIVSATDEAMDSPGNESLRENAGPIIKILSSRRSDLMTALAQAENVEQEQEPAVTKEFRYKLRPLAFEVAKQIKELVSQVEAVDEANEDDNFR